MHRYSLPVHIKSNLANSVHLNPSWSHFTVTAAEILPGEFFEKSGFVRFRLTHTPSCLLTRHFRWMWISKPRSRLRGSSSFENERQKPSPHGCRVKKTKTILGVNVHVARRTLFWHERRKRLQPFFFNSFFRRDIRLECRAGLPPWLFVVKCVFRQPKLSTYHKGQREQTFNICFLLHMLLRLRATYLLLCCRVREVTRWRVFDL